MDRFAVFVDAGYLFAEGSRLVAGERLPRGELHLDFDAVLGFLRELGEQLTGLPLLRVYWYDATSTGPTPQQFALAYRPNVKLRLGFVTQQGFQKGVDALLVSDLLTLSHNRAMADALLFSGDENLLVGVQRAQELGVRVHLVGIAPTRFNQAGLLLQEADTTRELGLDDVSTFLTRVALGPRAPLDAGVDEDAPSTAPGGPGAPEALAGTGAPGSPGIPDTPGSPEAPAVPGVPAAPEAASAPVTPAVPEAAGSPGTPAVPGAPAVPNAPAPPPAPVLPAAPMLPLEKVARQLAAGLSEAELSTVLDDAGGAVPPQLDRLLLIAATSALGGALLMSDQKRRLRAWFLEACEERGSR